MKAGILLFYSLLDEQQRRLFARWRQENDRLIADLLGLDPHTVAKGRRELVSHQLLRAACGALAADARQRKKNAANNPSYRKLLEHDTAGDPLTGLRWMRKTTSNVAAQLGKLGVHVSPRTVARLLRKLKFSLRVNHKKLGPSTLIATVSSAGSPDSAGCLANKAIRLSASTPRSVSWLATSRIRRQMGSRADSGQRSRLPLSG